MTTREILIAARALIATPERWTQGDRARDAAGAPIDPCDPRAVCWCISGALEAADPSGSDMDGFIGAALALEKVIVGLGHRAAIGDFNDAPERTHAEVLAAFDKAIAATEAAQ